MRIYELIESEEGSIVKATEGEKTLWIPLDPANSDYAEYLRLQDWLAEGKDEADFWNQSEVI
tara:strand:+ start:5439 stop:5624 length:186 start_codon:yes stop_codon:yes gene_type:complete